MQGSILIAIGTFSVLTGMPALAAEPVRRQPCAKIDPQRQLTPQQQRLRTQECRVVRAVPPVVDPTPLFLL